MNHMRFVISEEITKKLQEIGVEPNMFSCRKQEVFIKNSDLLFKWFENRGYPSRLFAVFSGYKEENHKNFSLAYEICSSGKIKLFDTYEEARIECIKELIKTYKNEL